MALERGGEEWRGMDRDGGKFDSDASLAAVEAFFFWGFMGSAIEWGKRSPPP